MYQKNGEQTLQCITKRKCRKVNLKKKLKKSKFT